MEIGELFREYEYRPGGVKDEHNSPSAFLELPEAHRKELLALIAQYVRPQTYFCHRMTSYGLKHIFEHLTSFGYVGNGAMKGAMLVAGYRMRLVHGGINGIFDMDIRRLLSRKLWRRLENRDA